MVRTMTATALSMRIGISLMIQRTVEPVVKLVGIRAVVRVDVTPSIP